MIMKLSEFEAERLKLFREQGFPATGRVLRDASGKSTYLIENRQHGVPTILLHGGLSESSQWFKVAGKLPGRIVMADRPGCGLSHPINYRGRDYFMEAAGWARSLADALEIDKMTLIANSMGGYFALAFALAHPERVAQLVLVGAPAGIDRYIPPPLRAWGNPLAGPVVGRVIKSTRSIETIRRNVFRWLVAHPGRLPQSFLEIALAARKLPGADIAAYSMLRCVLDLGGWRPEMSIRDRVSTLALPTDFIWGELDAFAPPSSGAELAAIMPDARMRIVTNAGHLPHLDEPDVTAKAIVSALTSARQPQKERA